MKQLFFYFLFGLTLISAHAGEEKNIHGFCFSDAVSFEEVRRYLHPITLPNDQLDMMGTCLEALISDARSTLFESYLQRKYRLTRTYSGSRPAGELAPTVQGNCQLEVLKKRIRERQIDELSVGRGHGKLKRTEEDLSGDTRSQLVLGKGQPGSLRMDQEEIFLTCQGGNNGNYTLTVTLRSPDSGISTTLNVTQGQPVNIGSVAKDLAGKNRTMSIATGIDYSKSSGQDNYDYFVTIR